MRFMAYTHNKTPHFRDRRMGVLVGDRIADLADIDAFYDDLDQWRTRAAKISEGEIMLADVSFAPPVPRDAKIICAAINYRKHGAESGLPTPEFPNLFARWTSELNVHGGEMPPCKVLDNMSQAGQGRTATRGSRRPLDPLPRPRKSMARRERGTSSRHSNVAAGSAPSRQGTVRSVREAEPPDRGDQSRAGMCS